MSDIIKQLALQLFLILLNAFFAATEIAVISLNEKKIKARAEDGDKKAGRMLKMIEEPTRFLSTIQIGITIAGFLGSAFAADNFAERLSDSIINTFGISPEGAGAVNTLSVIVITLILSFFTLVLGELVPKRVAMRHKEKLAELVCGVISGLAVALKPVIWLLTVSTNGVLRLIGIDPHAKDEPVSEEDDAGADEGTLKQDDIEYIKNVFKLDRLSAEDVMTPRKNIVSVSVDADGAQIVKTIETEGFSRIPVYSETVDHIIGVVHTRDILQAALLNKNFDIKKLMTEPMYVHRSMKIARLLSEFQRKKVHIAIVMDDYGGTLGIVTMEDVLEELVGEIYDERDEVVTEFTEVTPDTYEISGDMPVDDFLDEIDYHPADIEEDDYDTMNGLALSVLEHIPAVGETFQLGRLTFTVLEMEEQKIEKMRVILAPDSEKEAEKEKEKD